MDIRTVCVTIGLGFALTGVARAGEPISAAPPAPAERAAALAITLQTPIAANPLGISVQRAALTNSHLLTQDPPSNPTKKGSCAKRLLGLTAVGAGIGAGSALGLLYATGGSDSTGAIIRNFALTGTVLGVIAGTVACAAA